MNNIYMKCAGRFGTSVLVTILLFMAARPASADEQWTRKDFMSLFPAPPAGWTVSDMKVEELKSLIPDTNPFADMLSALSNGKPMDPPPAPRVRYRLTRDYQQVGNAQHNVEVVVDSEELEGAVVVMMANGYTTTKGGKRVRLSKKDDKATQKKLLKTMTPFSHNKRLGIRGSDNKQTFMALLLADKSVVSYECEYSNCSHDMDKVMRQTDFNQLERFVKFDHRKAKQKK